ncbi:hypothetical protein [Flavobacterium notoginsengisoli]|uniref:hypothetical protein n=1 Tax=Flavobacterium notoginsengisoli TaxID=1478199 RepID=UPI00363C1739
MTKEDAIEELMYQSGNHENSENERWQNGFLGQLRPFKGILHEENYHLIMKSLKFLAPEMEKGSVDKRIINSLWGICHLGRMWAVQPEGMLRRNNLITEDQIQQIDNWLTDISYTVSCLLDGAGTGEAFFEYKEN